MNNFARGINTLMWAVGVVMFALFVFGVFTT